jgi:hypothetical protein
MNRCGAVVCDRCGREPGRIRGTIPYCWNGVLAKMTADAIGHLMMTRPRRASGAIARCAASSRPSVRRATSTKLAGMLAGANQ